MQQRILLTLLALTLAACAAHPARVPSSADPGSDALEVALYNEGVAQFTAEIEARRPLISHPKHLPVIETQGHPTDYVVLLMHGMYESPWYLKGLRRNFHARGYNLIAPTLRHHWAVPLTDLNNADFHEWLSDALANLRLAHKLGKKVLVAGHSTGGMLAVYLAVQYPELVDGVMLWSPAVALTNKSYYSAIAGSISKDYVDLDYNSWAGKPPPDPEKVEYYSPLAGLQLMYLEDDLLDTYTNTHPFLNRPHWSVKRSMYDAIKAPVFLMNPEVDDTVDRPEVDLLWDSLEVSKVRYDLPGETHTSCPKDQDDYVPGAQTPNKDFPGMLEKLNKFLDQNFPPLAD